MPLDPATKRILIVDDERPARVGLKRALKGYDLLEAGDGEAALTLIHEWSPDLIMLDLNMPKLDGMGVLEKLQGSDYRGSVIVLTAYGNEEVAVRAMKHGAADYLKKPYDVEELRLTVHRALESLELKRENKQLKAEIADRDSDPSALALIGQSEPMRRVRSVISRVAELDVSVLLTGESGTGKELAARAIHDQSARRRGPFVAVNCAALPETLIESALFGHEKGAFTGANARRKGKFELARGGTLLLDEIGDMNIEVQAKLLRALEERNIEPLGRDTPVPIDVRVIAATHQKLDEALLTGGFRRDLYYRLKVVELRLPPLREHPDDVAVLVGHFNELLSQKHRRAAPSFTPEALRALRQRRWPGNVRELKNLLEGLFVMANGEVIGPEHLEQPGAAPPDPQLGAPLLERQLYDLPFAEARKRALRSIEHDLIEQALRRHEGNITHTAQELSMHRQSLQQKLKELGIVVNRFREA